ncbi:ribonuclease H-like domain-containing protein [Dichotomocladium elegans]|nr:ribonuclease H-like domain-containing protein [Dichotomocladium elegans]
MEILKSDFLRSLPEIKKALLDADCIAIDAEFTGLTPPGHHFLQSDSLNDRYAKWRQVVKHYSIIQYGVCAFKKTGESSYSAKPFNFYIFGGDTPDTASNRNFLCNASSLQFLREHQFDFNKLIDGGIPFYNFSETVSQSRAAGGKQTTIVSRSNLIDVSTLPNVQKKFVRMLKANINSWLQNGRTRTPLLVQVSNSFYRRIVHTVTQDPTYNGFLQARNRDTKHMQIFKLTEVEKRNNRNRVHASIKHELNFRVIIEYIKAANCPVILHNGILDLCHTIDQFWEYLPEQIHEFKQTALEMWPCIVDTKYLAEAHPLLKRCFDTTSLLPLYNTIVEEMKSSSIQIEIAHGYDRYAYDSNAQHEAGYDAYMTGTVFIGLFHYIKEREEDETETTPEEGKSEVESSEEEEEDDDEDEEEEEEEEEEKEEGKSSLMMESLVPYCNRLFQMRNDIPFINLEGVDVLPEVDIPNRFYLTNIPTGLSNMAICALYPELVPLGIHWVNPNTAWLIVRHENKIELAKEGQLGAAAIAPFLPDGQHAEAGSLLNITPEAANMELFSYNSWRADARFNPNPGTTSTKENAVNVDSPTSVEQMSTATESPGVISDDAVTLEGTQSSMDHGTD